MLIITKTPFRMSFFGGGTDIEMYFKKNGGAVLSTTFDKYCYVTVRHLQPFFSYASELAYAKIERVKDVEDIVHPAIRNAMKMLNIKDIRLTYEADLPARSGLGTSSSFAVGMLSAFHALKGEFADKRRLSEEAIYLERTLCREAGGWQDQIAASYGGFNRIDFHEGGFDVSPVIISPERKVRLNHCLIMFFTGFTRSSSEIHAMNSCADKVSLLDEMKSLVSRAESVLTDKNADLDEFGRLLDQSWRVKKKLGSAVSTASIDDFYEKGIQAGALGGKILGAGSGGFILFYVPPERRKDLLNAFPQLLHIPFEFETGGTKVIYYSPEVRGNIHISPIEKNFNMGMMNKCWL